MATSYASRSLLAFHQDSYEEHVQYHAICKPFYNSFLIPKYDQDIEYLLILSALELLIVLFLWLVLCMKKYYVLVEKNINKAKAILLPYYDRIVYYYSFIAIYRMILSIIQFCLAHFGNLEEVEHVWYLAAMDYLSSLCIISLELFIAFLIMQTSVGRNAFRRAFRFTLILCCILAILMLCQTIWGSTDEQFIVGLIFSIFIHGILLATYIAIFCYAFIYHQNLMKMKRARNKILYIYLFSIGVIHTIYTVSFILELTEVDGFCFIILGEYLYRIIFPIVAYITIKNDSKFWKNIIYSLQLVSNTSMGHIEIDADHFDLASSSMHHNGAESEIAGASPLMHSNTDDMILSGRYYRSTIKSIFGDDRHYDPIIAALELEINMINYEDLHDLSDPFAMGTTSFVHKAKWKGQDVAVKKWLFDEIDLSLESVHEFLRETLFSNIPHPNLVQFKGACLRPPELCLVYEYVNCGDLAALILPRYSHAAHPRHRDAIKMKHRLYILKGIAQGMTKLHQEGIIHRDLKTSNVLVKYDEQQQKFVAKVCDFGSARKLESMQREAAAKKMRTDSKHPKTSRLSFLTGFQKQHHDHPEESRSDQLTELNELVFNASLQTTQTTQTTQSAVTTRMTTQVGTLAFLAPELLSKIDVMKLLPPDQRRKLEKKAAAKKAHLLDIANMRKDSYQLLTDEEQKWSRKGTASSDTSQRSASKTPRAFFRSLTTRFTSREEIESVHDHHATNTFSFTIESKRNEEDNDPDFGGLTSMYDKSVDVFAFGCMMFEIGFLQRIYENMDIIDIYNIVTKNKRTPIPSYQECQHSKLNGFYVVSDMVYDDYVKLMKECWSQNPENRPSFEAILDRLDEIEQLRCGE